MLGKNSLTFLRAIMLLVLCIVAIQVIILVFSGLRALYYHLICSEVDYAARYGEGTWVVITGGSSGQGRRFAFEFARRGFNLLLIGSKRSFDVQNEIAALFPQRQVRVLLKDFTEAWREEFWDEIKAALADIPEKQMSFLINNIGHRVGYAPHHQMPPELIRNTIACGTITQAMMTRLALPYLLSRPEGLRSGMISITAQCIHPTYGFGIAMQNDLYLPYLAPYEASNAFGFFHANSIYHEYEKLPENNIDMLVITPGAVLTSNTEDVLSGTIGAVRDDEFVCNIMRLCGNVQGVWSGSWKQGLSLWLVGLVPPTKSYVLHSTGRKLAEGLMKRHQSRRRVID